MLVYVAVVERVLLPTGLASTLTTSFIGDSSSLTCAGKTSPLALALIAGTKESKIKLVLPAPEKPVTAVSRFSGNSTFLHRGDYSDH